MGSSWKLILVFGVLFLTGAVCGSLVTSSMAPKPGSSNPTRNFRSWSEDLTEKLKKNGKLTNDQQAKIRPYIEATVRQMQAVRLQSMIRISDTLDAMIAEIEPGLSPKQQERLEHFRDSRCRWLQKYIARQQEQ